MFQFIYHFIDDMNIDRINDYLDTKLPEIDSNEFFKIKNITKLLYYQIFGYFMNVYDSFKFEPSANFSTSEFSLNDNIIIQQYVQYFLKGVIIKNNYKQVSISDVVSQMEFYFTAEMMHMRQIQKFYYNILFNKQLILDKTSLTIFKILNSMTNTFLKTDYDQYIDPLTYQTSSDRVRKYWDNMYQHNIKKKQLR